MCPACRATYGAVPPVPASHLTAAAPVSQPDAAVPKHRPAPHADRLRRALRELPPEAHSVGQIAKTAGLNREKTLNRLHALQAAGEVQKIGKRWTSEPPPTDVEAAFDRLQARTSNLRIVRERDPVA